MNPFSKRHVAQIAALAMSAALVFSGCAQPAASPTAAKSTAAAAAPSGQPISVKVGLIAPLTGDVKTFGESERNAFGIAVEEANAEGKLKIEPVIIDDRNDTTEGVNAANKMAAEGVKAIVGPLTSKVAIAVSEATQAAKVVLVTGTATNPKVTVDSGKRKDYVFRTCFIDPFQGTVMGKFALTTLKAKKAAVLFDISNDYSKGLAEFFRDAFTAGGGEIVAYESYGKDDVDFSAQLTKIAAANPEFLYLPDYYNKVSLIAKQVRERGITAPMGGGDGWDSAELDFKATEGSYFSNHYSQEDPRPEVQAWVKKYQEKHGASPDALGTLGYDAAKVLFDAIIRAGSDDPAKIRDALAVTKDFKSVSGTLTFDKDGNPIKSAVILKIENGKQKYVETVNP